MDIRDLTASAISDAAAGKRDAQRVVVEASYEYVRQMLIRFVGAAREIEDLHQTALLNLVRSIGSFQGNSSFVSWVGAICVNVAKNHYRSRGRADAVLVRSSTEIDVENFAAGDMQSAMEARQALRRAMRALDSLSPNHRMVFTLKTFDGLSVEEIATAMNTARSTTRLRLYYARKAFAKALAREAADAPDAASEGK